jgi:hypothetical protein
MSLSSVVRRVCQRPRFHHLDRPRASIRRHSKPHIDDVQEVSGEGSAWGAVRWHGLRHEESWPMLGEGRQGLEQPLEEERRLFTGDILVEEGGQWLEEDHQPDGVGGEQGVEAVAEPCGQLPAGEGAHEMDPAQEDFWSDSAGLGDGDDRRDVKGHAGIHHRHLEILGQSLCGGAEGHLMHTRVAPQEH